MFQSYEFLNYGAYDLNTRLIHFTYKIVDSEFEQTGLVFAKLGRGWSIDGRGVGIAIIDTYENRNLPVVPNLIKAMIWVNKRHPYSTISEIINLTKRESPKFAKYEADVNKYLTLI